MVTEGDNSMVFFQTITRGVRILKASSYSAVGMNGCSCFRPGANGNDSFQLDNKCTMVVKSLSFEK